MATRKNWRTPFRERKCRRLYFGDSQEERWSVPDPTDPDLEEAMHRMRYEHGRLTEIDMWIVLASAEMYQQLCTYPIAGVAEAQLRDIRKAVKSGKR
jgi:hypothetical protein